MWSLESLIVTMIICLKCRVTGENVLFLVLYWQHDLLSTEVSESYGLHKGREQLEMLDQRKAQEMLDMRPKVLWARAMLSPMNL